MNNNVFYYLFCTTSPYLHAMNCEAAIVVARHRLHLRNDWIQIVLEPGKQSITIVNYIDHQNVQYCVHTFNL